MTLSHKDFAHNLCQNLSLNRLPTYAQQSPVSPINFILKERIGIAINQLNADYGYESAEYVHALLELSKQGYYFNTKCPVFIACSEQIKLNTLNEIL